MSRRLCNLFLSPSLKVLGRRCYATSNQLVLTFASTGDVLYSNQTVKQVDVPTVVGDVGILAQHVPTLGLLKPGVVNVVEEDGQHKKYFVSSGCLTMNDDSTVVITAEEAVRLDSLDTQAVTNGLVQAKQDLSGAATEDAKIEAQIAVDCYESIQKAMAQS